jgi:antitoxin PrlF
MTCAMHYSCLNATPSARENRLGPQRPPGPPSSRPGPPRRYLDAGETAWYYICIKVMEIIMESAITVKGQATIPKAIREHLRLKPGDRVKFFVHPDGSVVLLPKLPAAALRGMIKSRRRRPVTIGEMTDAAAEGAAGAAPRPGRR